MYKQQLNMQNHTHPADVACFQSLSCLIITFPQFPDRAVGRVLLSFCRFMNLKMRSMVFEDSLFEECYFEDITSSNTFFKNCTFIATLFYNTGRHAVSA